MANVIFRVWRGSREKGEFCNYDAEISEGRVVLDALHQIQASQAPDLAVRWNCKAGKCGSCSTEINGMPRLACMTRMNTLPMDQPITVEPMRTFPLIRDLVTDVSWNFEVKTRIKKFAPRKPDAEDGTWRMPQDDVDRVQEFRKCIECFLCQDVCHVLREHDLHDEFIGPRFFVQTAMLEMHPLDIVEVQPEHQQALVVLLLAITDQFGRKSGRTVDEARALLPRLQSDYEREYYAGIICERRAKEQWAQGTPGSGRIAFHWLEEAMGFYEKAEAMRPEGNDESILRWNTCARMINRHERLKPATEDPRDTFLE